eukprot:scpid66164/ scgid6624/ 
MACSGATCSSVPPPCTCMSVVTCIHMYSVMYSGGLHCSIEEACSVLFIATLYGYSLQCSYMLIFLITYSAEDMLGLLVAAFGVSIRAHRTTSLRESSADRH